MSVQHLYVSSRHSTVWASPIRGAPLNNIKVKKSFKNWWSFDNFLNTLFTRKVTWSFIQKGLTQYKVSSAVDYSLRTYLVIIKNTVSEKCKWRFSYIQVCFPSLFNDAYREMRVYLWIISEARSRNRSYQIRQCIICSFYGASENETRLHHSFPQMDVLHSQKIVMAICYHVVAFGIFVCQVNVTVC